MAQGPYRTFEMHRRGGDESKAGRRYDVLDPLHDVIARRHALREYAETTHDLFLALDLWDWLGQLEQQDVESATVRGHG